MNNFRPPDPAYPVGTFTEIRIENTNWCGYSCMFCPRDKMTRPQGMMSIDDFRFVLERVGHYDGRVDLHGFGEPLLDPDLIAKTQLVSSIWPQANTRIYTTLGVPVEEDYFDKLLYSGLSGIEVSLYGYEPHSYRLIHGVSRLDLVMRNMKALLRAKQKSSVNMEVILRDNPAQHLIGDEWDGDAYAAFKQHWIEDGGSFVRERSLHNFGNGRAYNEPGQSDTCSITWGYRKRILQITWDLNVVPCCFDFDSSVIFGNLRTSNLDDIFSSAHYQSFIEAHRNNTLQDYAVCERCERCTKK